MNTFSCSELSIGFEQTFTETITGEMLDNFVKLSGDCNPLHTDSVYAQKKGFKENVVHGMLTSALYSRLVGVYLPGKHCLLHGIDISFKKPVYIGDTLTISGMVSYINEAYEQLEIKAKIINQKNEVISKAKIKTGFLHE